MIALLVKTLSYGLHDWGCGVDGQEIFLFYTEKTVGPGYGLDGPGSNPSGGEIFLVRSDRPTQPLHIGYRVSFPGLSG